MSDSDDTLFYRGLFGIVAAFVLFLIIMITWSVHHVNDERHACQDRGGVYKVVRGDNLCLDPSVLR